MKTSIMGKVYEVDADLNLITPDRAISKSDMELVAKDYKGANRIYKPLALLFWTDVKNGKAGNWKKDV